MDGNPTAIAPLNFFTPELSAGAMRIPKIRPADGSAGEIAFRHVMAAQPADSPGPEMLDGRSGLDAGRSVHERFEAMFLAQLLSVMLETSEAGMGVDGTTGSVYSGWFSQAVADEIAARGGLGLADRLAQAGLAAQPDEVVNAEVEG